MRIFRFRLVLAPCLQDKAGQERTLLGTLINLPDQWKASKMDAEHVEFEVAFMAFANLVIERMIEASITEPETFAASLRQTAATLHDTQFPHAAYLMERLAEFSKGQASPQADGFPPKPPQVFYGDA
jgi:hypothetical protein